MKFKKLIQKKRKKCRERKQELTFQFKEAMQAVLGALMAGYSMENAFREAQNEMLQLYGQDTFMVKELQEINTKTALNEPLEKQLQNFAERSGIEDIETFCQVFLFAKRGGGDFLKIMKTTIRRIAEKIDVKREIDTMMAEKKLEQKVMQMVPVFILFYIDLTSPGFFEVMYGNVSGIAIMTGCLLLYLTALLLAGKITDVRV